MKWHVYPEESGLRLQNYLKIKLGDQFSARQIKHMIENNQCKVNNKIERFSSIKVAEHDQISLDVRLPTSPPVKLFEPERILFEDDHLLVYNKPAGIPSDNSKFIAAIRRKLPCLSLVHRLDKDTTGILLFAKTELALQGMIEQFRDRLITKVYLAIVDKVPKQNKGLIDNYLAEVKRYQGHTIWGSVKKEKGLHAVTEWQKMKTGEKCALIKCFPKTGRTHQLRVHLSEAGHPILGDYEYSKHFECVYKAPRCMLHALEIHFLHPILGNQVDIISPLPKDFKEAQEALFGKHVRDL